MNNFYIANLGPEFSRYLSFKQNKDFIQAENSKKRIFSIYEKILNLNKELESLMYNILYTESVTGKDVDKYFYPIILKLSYN